MKNNTPKYDTPAKRVLKKLGMTPTMLAARLRDKGLPTKTSTVCRWSYESPRGTGGFIPQTYHKHVMDIAKDMKVDIRAEDLLFV